MTEIRLGLETQIALSHLHGRSLTRDTDLQVEEVLALLDLASHLRVARRERQIVRHLEGQNIALIFEMASTRTRSAFEVAAHSQGAHVTYMGPDESQFGRKESARDTARVLGRMFDGVEFRGFAQHEMDTLAKSAGVPVWNGLTDEWHPTQALADLFTMRDHVPKPLGDTAFCFVGDARSNIASSLIVAGATMGMDVRIAAPPSRWPSDDVRLTADTIAGRTGAALLVTDDRDEAVRNVDFVYTDVWLSMGESEDLWNERIDLFLPYQVNRELLDATGNAEVKFLHCLPAMHNRETELGRRIFVALGIDALEVTDEVFESPASLVFDQAENRLHTIEAIMVATLITVGE